MPAMKQSIFILWTIFFLTSCAATNRVVKINGSNEEMKIMKLVQIPDAYSVEKTDSLFSRPSFSKVTSTFLCEEKKNDRTVISVNFQIINPECTDELDSVMFFVLDNEKIRIVAERDSSQLKSRLFMVPENLWISIANSQTVLYRLYLGKEEIDVKLNPSEVTQLKELFNQAIEWRDANFPALPEGQKNW